MSALEIGTYTITCKVTSPTNKTAVATKNNVKVTRLANTTVTNASNSNVSANAIYNKYDLHYFRDLVNGGQTTLNGKLMDSINLEGNANNLWTPMDNFAGIFDGNTNYVIKNVSINLSQTNNVGFFRNLTGAGMIKNVRFENLNVTGKGNTGGIVGVVNSTGSIGNCIISSGSVTGNENTGGIAGYTYSSGNSSISGCKVSASVMGGNSTGGIVGANNRPIINCGMYGTVTSNTASNTISLVGGIAGDLLSQYIFSCVNKGPVTGQTYVGGITGDIRSNAYVSYCYNTGNITSTGGVSRNIGLWWNRRRNLWKYRPLFCKRNHKR